MEYWDIYDDNLKPTGKTFYEGIKLNKGEYGFLVHIIIKNKDGKFLLQQRAFTKKYYPGQWDATCGRVQAGESGIEAAMREVKEELGLDTKAENYTLLFHNIYHNTVLLDIFLLNLDFSIDDCIIQKDEVETIGLYTFEEMLEILMPSKDNIYIDILNTKIEKKS